MFIRQFRKRKKTKRYKEFVARYELFHPDDISLLCGDHHEEIHLRYMNIVYRDIKSNGYTALEDYTWEQAEKLMKKLEKEFKEWIAVPTPGIKERKFVS